MRWSLLLLVHGCAGPPSSHCDLVCEDRLEISAHAAVYVAPSPYATIELCVAHACGAGHYGAGTVTVTGPVVVTGSVERSTDGGLDIALGSAGSGGSLGLVDGDVYSLELDDHVAYDLKGTSAPITYTTEPQPCGPGTCSMGAVPLVLVQQ